MIADRFDISIDTVRAHIRNIYKKLHVHSKAEVIAKSLKGEI
jgi:DNA-binding CsgD family transcriptional regulator